MERLKEINEIIDFVERYKESTASQIIMSRILGGYYSSVDDSVISELKNRISNANDDDIEACYYIVK